MGWSVAEPQHLGVAAFPAPHLLGLLPPPSADAEITLALSLLPLQERSPPTSTTPACPKGAPPPVEPSCRVGALSCAEIRTSQAPASWCGLGGGRAGSSGAACVVGNPAGLGAVADSRVARSGKVPSPPLSLKMPR